MHTSFTFIVETKLKRKKYIPLKNGLTIYYLIRSYLVSMTTKLVSKCARGINEQLL